MKLKTLFNSILNSMIDRLRDKAYRFLRWTERYTKTDMVYLTSGGFWLFFGQAVTTLAALGLAIAFANLIEPEKYGNYKYVLALASIVSAFTLTGLTTAVTRATARGYEGTLKYAFRLSLVWSVGMVFISALGAAYYFYKGNDFLGTSLLIIGATSPLISASSLYRPFLMGRKNFKKASLLGIVQSAIPTLSVLAGVLFGAPLLLLVSIYFGVTAFSTFLLYNHAVSLSKNENVDAITTFLGKHLSIMGIISTIGERLDSILIFQLLGGTELAVYSLAKTMPDTIKGSMKNIDALAMPKFAVKTKTEMKRAVWSKTLTIFLVMVSIAILYILLAPFIFQLIFPKYLNAIPYTQIYAIVIPLSFALASAYFDSQAAVKERYILRISNVSFQIVSIAIGIYFLGLWGAIFARVAARIFNVSLSAFFIAKH